MSVPRGRIIRPHLESAIVAWGRACYELGAAEVEGDDASIRAAKEQTEVKLILLEALIEVCCRSLDGDTRLIDRAVIESMEAVDAG